MFLPDERAAFAFTRALTVRPDEIGDEDIAALQQHIDDRKIVELVFTIGRFNSTTRWTDSLGIPQDQGFGDGQIHFDQPTSARFVDAPSIVAPSRDEARPQLEPRSHVEAALNRCRERVARVALPADDQARALLTPDQRDKPAPEWVRALAYFPQTGAAQVAAAEAVAKEGKLDKLLKAQIAWTSARHNRAWYALADAERRLSSLGQSVDQVFALDGPSEELSPGTREALAFAAKLTASPQRMTDGDIERLRRYFSDYETAEIVYVVCHSNSFDRFTEALGLRWID